ncbi:hypothetical protein [Nostoc sp.]|uniref:hypothetical protein n=1 Tax=Nostoc sp. TaxID=1180 RepID=UPI003FA5E063
MSLLNFRCIQKPVYPNVGFCYNRKNSRTPFSQVNYSAAHFWLSLRGRIRVARDLHHALMLGALAEGETEIQKFRNFGAERASTQKPTTLPLLD